MEQVGLRALRQDASEIVRRVERGERIDITVAGRVAATIVPPGPRQWLAWEQLAEVFGSAGDLDWQSDRTLIDESLTNPWDR